VDHKKGCYDDDSESDSDSIVDDRHLLFVCECVTVVGHFELRLGRPYAPNTTRRRLDLQQCCTSDQEP
jgi:hypothetical protein